MIFIRVFIQQPRICFILETVQTSWVFFIGGGGILPQLLFFNEWISFRSQKLCVCAILCGSVIMLTRWNGVYFIIKLFQATSNSIILLLDISRPDFV